MNVTLWLLRKPPLPRILVPILVMFRVHKLRFRPRVTSVCASRLAAHLEVWPQHRHEGLEGLALVHEEWLPQRHGHLDLPTHARPSGVL